MPSQTIPLHIPSAANLSAAASSPDEIRAMAASALATLAKARSRCITGAPPNSDPPESK